MKLNQARAYIKEGHCGELFERLYGERAEEQKARYLSALDSFEKLFGTEKEIAVFSAPGRTEIGGNHTDHNGGRVLAGSVDFDVIAVVAKEENDVVHVHSQGFSPDTANLSELDVRSDEIGKSAALIRGVAKGFLDRAFAVGGFTAYTESNVPKGSGVSSSAAFEVLLGSIFNHLYNEGKVDAVEIAKISQFAEREYFGKPCGLMDQAACAVGGIVAMGSVYNSYEDAENHAEPADYVEIGTGYTVTAAFAGVDGKDVGGTVSGAGFYAEGAEVTLTITSDMGCELKSVTAVSSA